MAGERTKKAGDAIVEGKHREREPVHESVGAALKRAVEASKQGMHQKRKDRSPLWNQLNSLSPYVRKEYVEARKRAVSEKAEKKVDSFYSSLTTQEKVEEYLRTKCLPALGKKLESAKKAFEFGTLSKEDYDRRKKGLQEDISLAILDERQLRTMHSVAEITQQLGKELEYQYLPLAFAHKVDPLIVMLCGVRKGTRESILPEIETLVEKFKEFAASPSKAREYILSERGKQLKDDTGINWDALIECDLAVAERHVAGAAPPATECVGSGARCRFRMDDFEAISDAEGSRVMRLIHRDGSQAVFLEGGEVRVTDARGKSAIFQNERLVQRGDAEGNLIQYVDGKKARIMSADGYMIIMDPDNPHKNAITDRHGGIVLRGKKHEECGKNFEQICKSLEQTPLMDIEGNTLSAEEILSRAKAKLESVGKRLREFEARHKGHGDAVANEALGIARLSEQLRALGRLEYEGEPGADGFDATLDMYKNNYDVRVLPVATLSMLRNAVKRNHPANSFPNPEKTLVIEVPRMFFLENEEKEHPIQYTRLFTIGTGGGEYITVLALHREMVKAIISDDFKVVGERIYREVAERMHARGLNMVRFKLAWMPNSDVCREIADFYGKDFLSAMRAKDFNALGRQEAYDNLVHNVTHTFTRPAIRNSRDGQLKSLRITDADEKRASEYCALAVEGKRTFKEQKEALLDLYLQAYGLDLPTDLERLDSAIAGLKKEFLSNPHKESYLAYLKADELREILRRPMQNVNEFTSRAKSADLSKISEMSEKEAAAYRAECRKSFRRLRERELIVDIGRAVDEGLAIAMQRTRYHSRAGPTAFSISIHLQGIAKEIGQEMLFNEISGETAPWDLIRRANQLRDVSRGYNDWPFIENRAKTARVDEAKDDIRLLLEAIRTGAALAKL